MVLYGAGSTWTHGSAWIYTDFHGAETPADLCRTQYGFYTATLTNPTLPSLTLNPFP